MGQSQNLMASQPGAKIFFFLKSVYFESLGEYNTIVSNIMIALNRARPQRLEKFFKSVQRISNFTSYRCFKISFSFKQLNLMKKLVWGLKLSKKLLLRSDLDFSGNICVEFLWRKEWNKCKERALIAIIAPTDYCGLKQFNFYSVGIQLWCPHLIS